MRLVAPAFAWAEVASVLRKKVRLGAMTSVQAEGFYNDFCQIPVDYLDSDTIRGMGLGSFNTARRTIRGYAIMNMRQNWTSRKSGESSRC